MRPALACARVSIQYVSARRTGSAIIVSARVARLAAYARDAQLKAAGRQALTRITAQAAGGVATAGVYAALVVVLALSVLR